MSILIKDVSLDGKTTDIYIEENRITELGKKTEAEHVLDGRGKAALPGMVNTHTHAAMTLLRSYADDLLLQEWLQQEIWPFEAKMGEEDVYWGAKLACLEMIKSGTTCFSDMYWHMRGTARAVSEMGLRAVLAESFIDLFKEDMAGQMKKANKDFIRHLKEDKNPRIKAAIGPHAVYTVSEESLRWVREYAEKEDLLIHFHLAETEKENRDCQDMHGKRPVPFLEEAGFLCERLVCAHCIWLDPKELDVLKKHEVKISHNPTSNLKLASGLMPYPAMKAAGLTLSLGTDGCASNNNLDMFEEMKIATLAQKGFLRDPTAMPAHEVYQMATSGGGEALGLQTGKLEEGMLADMILIDLRRPELTPANNLTSDLVYSANGCCVNTTICDGKVLMEDRRIEGEEDILQKVVEVVGDIKAR